MSARPTHRTGQKALPVLLAACIALVAVAGFLLGAAQHTRERADGSGWFADAVGGGIARAAQAVALTQANSQLAKRAKAIESDESQFEESLSEVPWVMLKYRLASGSLPQLAELSSGEFDAAVISTYRLAVDPVLVAREVSATFRLTDRGWRLTDVGSSPQDLWSFGPVTSARSGKSLVIASQSLAGRASSLATQAESARFDVDTFWTQPWPGRVVVNLPGRAQWMDELIGDDSASKFPAVATRDPGKDGSVNRVTVNPRVFDGLPYLGQQIILRHEITHVAQNALAGQRGVPLWLVEGFATYAGYRGSGVPDSVVGRLIFAEVRESGLPLELPKDAAFAFERSTRERGLAYEKGWSVCAMIADDYGEAQVVAFYAAVAGGEGRPAQRVHDAAQRILSVSGRELLERWQSWLQVNA